MFEALYVERSSPVHRLSLWTKALAMLLFVPFLAFLAKPVSLLITALLVCVLLLLSRSPLRLFWQHFQVYFISFLAGSVVLALAFSQGSWTVRFLDGVVWAIRFALVVASALLFAATTDPIELPINVVRLGIPHRYGITLMVAVQMMPLISNNLRNIVQAQRARGLTWSLVPANWLKLPANVLSLGVPGVLSTLEASVALSDTLLARGYDPYAPMTLWPRQPGLRNRLGDIILCMIVGVTTVLVILKPALLVRY